ncbi:MAG: amino acid permease [Bdellovibrionota bacterium]
MKKFGTFKGVFIPSVLTILGVIMYLRMGWVLGNVGLFGSLIIVTLASAITFLTGLSISATSTNMKVKGGGAYYMISRSFGVEAGAAVGIPLYFAQAIGIAFYLAGFAESLHAFFPDFPSYIISICGLIILTGLAIFSADVALKTQFFVFIIILLSLVSFFLGSPLSETAAEPSLTVVVEQAGFWAVFAVFFPAVTGIEAGLSMSGDLKDPAKSLPRGTLAAVLFGYCIYLAIPVFLSIFVSEPSLLLAKPMIMKEVAYIGQFVVLGLWGATLSSALGAILGAPRTLQALARDSVIWSKFGEGYGAEDAPRIATGITFFVALGGILLGDLNVIAPILSMFFLTSYGVLNLSAAVEGMIANPSWRPKLKFPWVLSLIGGVFCFAVMFMINPGATMISMCLTFLVYYFMQKRKLTARWDDMRRGILIYLARLSISKLANLRENSKSWRPNLLVLSGAPTKRWYLIELADAITHGKGFMTIATILPTGSAVINRINEMQKAIEEFLKKNNIPSLVRISVADTVNSGVQSLVRDYGLGPIYPNTIILGETEQEENFNEFAEMLITIYQAGRNIVVIRESGLPLVQHRIKRIDVWWGRERRNAGLSLALGYMLQSSPEWEGSRLALKSVTTTESENIAAQEILDNYLAEGRLEADANTYSAEANRQSVFNKIRSVSKDAQLVFIGMRPPNLDEYRENPEKAIKEYELYYKELLDVTRQFPACAIVIAAEDIDFHKIFSA